MSAIQPPEPDLDALEASDTKVSMRATIKYLGDLRKYETEKIKAAARAKVDAELDTARQLESEASGLTQNLKRYF